MAKPEHLAESACHREYFYVGGTYAKDTSGMGGDILRDQAYVECLTPVGGASRPHPLIFVHGGGHTGAVCHRVAGYSHWKGC